MLLRILFFILVFVFLRSLYVSIRLISFDMQNLNDYGLGTLTGHIVLMILLATGTFFLGKRIWFKKQ